MVYRIFVEKKPGLAHEAEALLYDLREVLRVEGLKDVRIFNRYDAENISEELFEYAVHTVFSEPQIDKAVRRLPEADCIFAVEYLPGQFDQRASSAEECIQIISKGERPTVSTAKVYALYGKLTEEAVSAIKKYVINPVEAREAEMTLPQSLKPEYEIPQEVETVEGFTELTEEELAEFIKTRGLAMDTADLLECRKYFRSENRQPTITEIRMIDTYWSDHCRHTTFNTTIDHVVFKDEMLQEAYERYLGIREKLGRAKPISLMDIGTIAAKYLKAQGKLSKLDESDEINACTVKIEVEHDGKKEDWLLLFKNETHNHPTEIEPFGGAATCIGGAIRDPLSGRSYVYGAMRLTGAGDPLTPVSETLAGKLPQRKLVTTAAAGYSSYGNQIGLATGQVDEIYHPGYVAKHMEIGAVVGAAPAENVVRETPQAGDKVILLGGKTGRDGCGGATGSSKKHDSSSLENCGAEVQKGNAPEERKLQRLFRNPTASKMIKRCNDFGAGGVSVAVGELADGLKIDLNRVPKKYEGLDGTELAISESQERMAVVTSAEDAERFIALAASENLEATIIAEVTEEPRLVMSWNGKTIVDLSRAFLDSNGAEKHIDIVTPKAQDYQKEAKKASFKTRIEEIAEDLNCCSKRGLSERFDSTIGAGTVLMPFGGKYQRTPAQAMVHKIPVEKGDTATVSMMAWGYNPFITEKSPYHGAYLAVVESVCKLAATGASLEDIYLSFQEYFEKLEDKPERWGKPFAALLGALDAQIGLEAAAIGGKDSMSGSFEDLHVPPTLVSFACTTENIDSVISPEFKEAENFVYLLKPEENENGLPDCASIRKNIAKVHKLIHQGIIKAAWTPGMGGAAEALIKMIIGNRIGIDLDYDLNEEELFAYNYGAFVLETTEELSGALLLGRTCSDFVISKQDILIDMLDILDLYEKKLESVYPCNLEKTDRMINTVSYRKPAEFASAVKIAKPKALIPVFPGTNCEYDTAKAFERAGAESEIFVLNNLSPAAVAKSVEVFAEKIKESQMIFIPGGFSGGDEPDGSGKLITAFFRNPEIKEAVTQLLEERDGLMAGICNGFQALIKLGLVPYGKIIDTDETCPTLTYNRIGRHQSKLVRTRIASNKSPWLMNTEVGEIYTVPISHGEGRFIAGTQLLQNLADNGQIITQYVDLSSNPTDKIQYNPNGSDWAVEGLISPDGRVLGKMGHSERIGSGLYRNVPGRFDMQMFESAVRYFK